jgi:hypothetical protein
VPHALAPLAANELLGETYDFDCKRHDMLLETARTGDRGDRPRRRSAVRIALAVRSEKHDCGRYHGPSAGG